ncbi:unnamed protein product [Cylicocyclus nassatus]|uniref:RING-CH-type domain-containing protein n=1 Tax=Cylicocyclus nassatus TaxID=53992 RepID=A0AA36H8E3_CYLNA|nr:unnamed protein product [Cylicocyclus nassatus]
MPVLATSLNSSLGPAVCRVCLCGETSIPYLGKSPGEPLISPCHCKGTMGLYHRSCLEHWLSISRTYWCEICKFRYEVGRRKQGFLSYIRDNWHCYGASSEGHSIAGDCACLLILLPLTIGGSILCLQSAAEKLQYVNEKGDFERVHEIVALGLMALFLIVIFGFWVVFMVMFYSKDFYMWQKKNMKLYVIDQLDREEETSSRLHNRLSESLRPLLIKKKLKKFFCCGWSVPIKEDTVIPLQDAILDLNPQLVEATGISFRSSRLPTVTPAAGPILVSPISCASNATPLAAGPNLSTAILVSTLTASFNGDENTFEVPTMSTFRPHYTSASAQMLVSTPFRTSPLSVFDAVEEKRLDIGTPCGTSTESDTATDVPGSPIASLNEAVATTRTSPRVETLL